MADHDAVLFDLDGVLVDSRVPFARSVNTALASSETTVFPGIREILEELSEHMPLIVATSKPRALAEPLLGSLDLRCFFIAVIGPELDSENEQEAVTVGRAMRELEPEAHPVMVGDRKHDIAAAHKHDRQTRGRSGSPDAQTRT